MPFHFSPDFYVGRQLWSKKTVLPSNLPNPPANLPNDTMALPANHQQLVIDAQKRANEHSTNLEKQVQTSDGFAKIGAYTSSEAEREQLRRLAAIQDDANKTVFDSRVRF